MKPDTGPSESLDGYGETRTPSSLPRSTKTHTDLILSSALYWKQKLTCNFSFFTITISLLLFFSHLCFRLGTFHTTKLFMKRVSLTLTVYNNEKKTSAVANCFFFSPHFALETETSDT